MIAPLISQPGMPPFLAGVSAGGVVGALVAVPLVGAVKAVYLETRTA